MQRGKGTTEPLAGEHRAPLPRCQVRKISLWKVGMLNMKAHSQPIYTFRYEK